MILDIKSDLFTALISPWYLIKNRCKKTWMNHKVPTFVLPIPLPFCIGDREKQKEQHCPIVSTLKYNKYTAFNKILIKGVLANLFKINYYSCDLLII